MTLDFEEKQILRSISNLVVKRPNLMKAALSLDKVVDSEIFRKLEPVFTMVKSTPFEDDNESKENYYISLKIAISEISDREIKDFISQTISQYINE